MYFPCSNNVAIRLTCVHAYVLCVRRAHHFINERRQICRRRRRLRVAQHACYNARSFVRSNQNTIRARWFVLACVAECVGTRRRGAWWGWSVTACGGGGGSGNNNEARWLRGVASTLPAPISQLSCSAWDNSSTTTHGPARRSPPLPRVQY